MVTTPYTDTNLKPKFLPAQKLFMESLHPELLYSGAFGAGKSYIGCEKGLFLSLKYPGNVGAIIRKTFAHLRITTMETFIRYVCPPNYIQKFDKETWTLHLINGSKILFLGLDQKTGVATKVGSLELGWVFVDEAVELDEPEWEMLQGRLRLKGMPFFQIFAATNPGDPYHWLYRRFTDGSPHRKMVESNSLDNIFSPAEYRERLSRFKGIYYDRFVLGKWIGMEGLVYPAYNPSIHIIEPFDIPPTWERYRSIDFGYTNAFVCQWWCRPPQLSHSGDDATTKSKPRPWYRYKEIYYSQRTITQHAQAIKQHSAGVNILCTVADWDAGDRAELSNCGIPSIKANKEINLGVQHCLEQLEAGLVFFFRDAVVETDQALRDSNLPASTEEEFGGYRWPGTRRTKNPKEVPIDKNNHGMDAMRYVLWTLSDHHSELNTIHAGIVSRAGRGVQAPSWSSGHGGLFNDRDWVRQASGRGSWRGTV